VGSGRCVVYILGKIAVHGAAGMACLGEDPGI
jgi:hypothetical protein